MSCESQCWGHQEMLKLAAKQRIRRMVQPKKRRTDLQAPAWLAKRWNQGTKQKDEMADVMQQVNWDKACKTNS